MSIKRTPRGWQVNYTPNTTTHYCKTFPTHALAKQFEAEKKALHTQKKHKLDTLPLKLTFETFVEDWYVARYAKEKHQEHFPRVYTYLKTIKEAFASVPLTDIDYSDLEDWLSAQTKERGWAQATKNYYTALIKRMFKMAVRWRLLRYNPASELEKPKPNNERRRIATPEEMEAVWEHATPRLKRTLVGLLNSGIRKGRIEGLEWEHVNMATRKIVVSNKKGLNYVAYINKALYAELEEVPETERVGKVFDTTNLRKDWEQARKEAGCTDLWLHDLRRTFATWSTRRTKDLNKTQKALGHASPTMTNRYRQVLDKDLKEAFQSVHFKPKKKGKNFVDISLMEGREVKDLDGK